MNIFFDTEFYIPAGEPGVVKPISIGAVREDGCCLYAQIEEFDWRAVPRGDWLWTNVQPLLDSTLIPLERIREELIEFAGSRPQFWAYYGAYDWVAMCHIMGGFMNLPKGWSKACFEIKQLQMAIDPAMILPKQETPEHHALNDALWNRDIYEAIRDRRIARENFWARGR